jgi:hypothetical protein
VTQLAKHTIMLLNRLISLGAVGSLTRLAAAQFPKTPEGVTVLESQVDPGVRLSYKEVGCTAGLLSLLLC